MTHIITESEVEDGVVPFTYGALQTDTGWRAVKNDSVATRAAQALREEGCRCYGTAEN